MIIFDSKTATNGGVINAMIQYFKSIRVPFVLMFVVLFVLHCIPQLIQGDIVGALTATITILKGLGLMIIPLLTLWGIAFLVALAIWCIVFLVAVGCECACNIITTSKSDYPRPRLFLRESIVQVWNVMMIPMFRTLIFTQDEELDV